MLNQQQMRQSSALDSTTEEVQLPRFRRFFSGHGGGNRRRRFLAGLPPYNYKTDCIGAQKLFYIGFVLSSIASIVFLISFVYNSSSRSRGGSGAEVKGGSGGSQWNDSTTADASSGDPRPRRPELGLFETLALLCSAFGLCLIAGVFLCGLYVTRRRKDIEEQRLLAVTPTGMCGGDDAVTETETSDLSSYSLSTRLDAGGGRCSGCGAVNPRRRRSSRQNSLCGGEEFNNGSNEEANNGRYDESEDDETDDDDASDKEVEEAGGMICETEGAATAGAADLVRRALGSAVPQLRRCTCGQIGTVSKASERRAGAEQLQLPNSPQRQQHQQQHVIGLF